MWRNNKIKYKITLNIPKTKIQGEPGPRGFPGPQGPPGKDASINNLSVSDNDTHGNIVTNISKSESGSGIEFTRAFAPMLVDNEDTPKWSILYKNNDNSDDYKYNILHPNEGILFYGNNELSYINSSKARQQLGTTYTRLVSTPTSTIDNNYTLELYNVFNENADNISQESNTG